MASTLEQQLEQAQALAKSEPTRAEALYKEILKKPASDNAEELRHQETALVKLGELYRDQKCVSARVVLPCARSDVPRRTGMRRV